jgi:uncharacterized protein YbjT (DUF2867 family)
MNVVLFGASGMVGQGVLRECVLSPDVAKILVVGRKASGETRDKVEELVHADFEDFSGVAGELTGYDACFWCLGVTSAGMTEAEYTRVTYTYTMAAARVLAEKNPTMTFVFVSGAGTDETEKSKTMWARVKGKAENGVATLPFKATYAFRPGFIQPLHGIVSRTTSYRVLYAILGPFGGILRRLFPGMASTTELVGRAMLRAASHGAGKRILETRDINDLARAAG